MCWQDILTNLSADCIFVILVILVLAILYPMSRRLRFGKASQFFGFRNEKQIKIYVAAFEHERMSSRRVVTAMEYEAAVEIRGLIERLAGSGVAYRLMDFLAGLIGQDIGLPAPDIEAGPLEEVEAASHRGTLFLIGGPVTNQLSRFYLKQGSPRFRFDETKQLYQERTDDGYKDINPSGNVAVIEKRVYDRLVIFLAHGFGEEDTKRAVQYLVNHWEALYKLHREDEFGLIV
jgi:hypothetical protein